MAFLTWNDEFLIGDATVDAEHRELFRLINDFHDHWMEARDRADIGRVLTQLVRYAEDHFQHEEAAMRDAGYPLLDEHHQVHEQLFETIFRLHDAYVNRAGTLELQTMKFVRGWLVDHIVQNDYKFRDFLARNKDA